MAKLIIGGAVVVVGAVVAAVVFPESAWGRLVRNRGGVADPGRDPLARAGGPRTVHEPDPDVSDLVLTDRVRSELGPLEKRLDLPHVQVMVEDHQVLLHGVVGSAEDARAIEAAVLAVSGVRGVDSRLHVGLGDNDSRPSAGREVHQSSPAHRRLLDAAIAAGVDAGQASCATRAVLGTFVARIPDDERRHLLLHLPEDVRWWAEVAPVLERGYGLPRTVDGLVAEVVAEANALCVDPSMFDAALGERATEAVLGTLRELVPEEIADIAATLPDDLRGFWSAAIPG